MERKALAVASFFTALPFPLLIAIVLNTIRVNIETPQFDFHQYAMNTIGLFLLLIFVAPLTTIFSLLSGYVAFRQSQFWAKKLAVLSFAVTLVGIVLLIMLVTTMQSAPAPSPDAMIS